jgi:type I restriction enzyme, S subunit
LGGEAAEACASPKPEDTNPEFAFRYIDIANVDSTGNVLDTPELRFGAAPSRARRLVRDGDIILSTVRTYLRAIALMTPPTTDVVVSTGFAVLRSLPGVNPGYLWRLVQASPFIENVVANSEGIG